MRRSRQADALQVEDTVCDLLLRCRKVPSRPGDPGRRFLDLGRRELLAKPAGRCMYLQRHPVRVGNGGNAVVDCFWRHVQTHDLGDVGSLEGRHWYSIAEHSRQCRGLFGCQGVPDARADDQ